MKLENNDSFGKKKEKFNSNDLKNFTYGRGGNKYNEATKALVSHVTRHYSPEMRFLVKHGAEATFNKPVLDKTANETEKAEWKMLFEFWNKDQKMYKKEKAKVFQIVCDMCEDWLQERIEGSPQHQKMETDFDVIALMNMIKDIAFGARKRNTALCKLPGH